MSLVGLSMARATVLARPTKTRSASWTPGSELPPRPWGQQVWWDLEPLLSVGFNSGKRISLSTCTTGGLTLTSNCSMLSDWISAFGSPSASVPRGSLRTPNGHPNLVLVRCLQGAPKEPQQTTFAVVTEFAVNVPGVGLGPLPQLLGVHTDDHALCASTNLVVHALGWRSLQQLLGDSFVLLVVNQPASSSSQI
jgi:hypothetical protein